MQSNFQAVQLVEMAVPDQPIPIQHYLRQPQRLVRALVDPSRLETLGADLFRLKLRPLSFMMFSIQPVVDLQVWAEANGVIHVRSVASEIRGIDALAHCFQLDLVGQLAPQIVEGKTYLKGRADLKVQLELPPSLWFTPRSLVEATGNGLLRSVLLTIKQRLINHLLSDYRRWVTAQLSHQEAAVLSSSHLPESSL